MDTPEAQRTRLVEIKEEAGSSEDQPTSYYLVLAIEALRPLTHNHGCALAVRSLESLLAMVKLIGYSKTMRLFDLGPLVGVGGAAGEALEDVLHQLRRGRPCNVWLMFRAGGKGFHKGEGTVVHHLGTYQPPGMPGASALNV